ncbi:23S rRNA (uracil(1939)-C(5))-methyltransferase RlmD [Falcatimonas sp. MSJ-15]|uniref:23S rRNA (uracil(1939)-C(5))-methyltransferase RlmD n=1 Tax=Falcatimonas sp. MSJ-15 TaxID=2841515 RepID=UPI001C1177C9|nr:23S rRNA (uracil(1939)-C(5))-methyltransferase RlmD [Falcatimonas sp. MSJ-15]MBU5470612.1 23S rRNA (uracil(1939)-C(5))-methyltransferase RlmD [Falcatimonas sp. MSJ-15]
MKKGQYFESVIERVDFPNKAVTYAEDRKVIIKNAIPGQKVGYTISKMRKDKCEGRLVEVVEKSPLETVEDVCEHFGICGGCTYQSLPYEEQLKIKEGQVKSLLDSVISDYEFEGILGSPKHLAYRNKMEFSFGDEVKDGPLALGMHKRGSFHDIVTVSHCKIVDTDYNKILKCVLNYFTERKVDFYHKMQHTGYLRHLIVRKAVKTKEILIDLVTTTSENHDLTQLVTELNRLTLEGKIVGILHTNNDSLADAVINEGTEVLYGQEFFYEELLGLKFKITPFSFFQTNSLGAEVLYSKAREYVGDTKDKVIFDLYSGTGTIAQILAPVAKKVIGVEIVEEAVEAAKVNAKLNGLDNLEFIAGDVLKVIDGITDKPDFIVLDPPREGINPKALDKIINYGVDNMVYISCKPTSLVRDLEILKEKGYKVVKAALVDMFAGTGHVETICSLTRIK